MIFNYSQSCVTLLCADFFQGFNNTVGVGDLTNAMDAALNATTVSADVLHGFASALSQATDGADAAGLVKSPDTSFLSIYSHSHLNH